MTAARLVEIVPLLWAQFFDFQLAKAKADILDVETVLFLCRCFVSAHDEPGPAHVFEGLRELHAVFGLAKQDRLLFEILEGHLIHIDFTLLLILTLLKAEQLS